MKEMAKKSSSGAKGKQLSVRLTDESYELVRQKADAEKRSMAYIIEELIQKALGDSASNVKEKG